MNPVLIISIISSIAAGIGGVATAASLSILKRSFDAQHQQADAAKVQSEEAAKVTELTQEQIQLLHKQNTLLDRQNLLTETNLIVSQAISKKDALGQSIAAFNATEDERDKLSGEIRSLVSTFIKKPSAEQQADLSKLEYALTAKMTKYHRDFWQAMFLQAEYFKLDHLPVDIYFQWMRVLLKRIHSKDSDDPINYSIKPLGDDCGISDQDYRDWIKKHMDRMHCLSYKRSADQFVKGRIDSDGRDLDIDIAHTNFTGTTLQKILVQAESYFLNNNMDVTGKGGTKFDVDSLTLDKFNEITSKILNPPAVS